MKSVIVKVTLCMLVSLMATNSFARWQCYVADKKGHYWASSGMTQENATAVAMSYCSTYSPNGSCHNTECKEQLGEQKQVG